MSDHPRHPPLREHLDLSAGRNCLGEPVVSLQASQPFFGLSRAHVRALYQMLLDAGTALHQLCDARAGQECAFWEEEDENGYETATTTLQRKVRFVVRGLHQEPVALLGLETLACELTQDELTMFDLQVGGLLLDLKVEEASWFYACEYFTGSYHLMDKGQYDRRGPALCGNRPMLQVPVAEGSILRGWFLLPLGKEEELNEQRVCPLCLALWKAQQKLKGVVTRQEDLDVLRSREHPTE